MTNSHLVILRKKYLNLIIDGRKKIESRFWKKKHPAFEKIAPGDRLFLKVSSGPVCATVIVKQVKKFDSLSPAQIRKLKMQYNDLICGPDEYWQSKQDCKYGLLVGLTGLKIIEPIRIKKKDWRAWVVLTKKQDFGLLTKSLTA